MRLIRYITLVTIFTRCFGLAGQEVSNGPQIETDPVQVEERIEPVAEGADNGNEQEQPVELIEEAEENSHVTFATVTPVEDSPSVFRGDLVIIGSDNSLGIDERSRDMITIMGNSSASGHVDGDMVTVLGSSYVNGHVDGDMVTVLGSAEVGPNADIDGDVVVIGGSLTVHPDAKVNGERVNIPFFPPGIVDHFQEVPVFIRECVFLARPISPNVKLTFYVAGVFLLFYILLAALFPRPLERSRLAIEEKPFHSFLAGVLGFASYFLFLVLMAITVIGLILVPFAKLSLLAIVTFGKAVVFFYMGKQIARAIRVSFLEHSILSILLGGVVVYSLYMIPFFGLFLWMLLSTLGLGAACMAIGNSISERKTTRQAGIPAPISGSAPQAEKPSPAYQSGGSIPPGTALSQVDYATAAVFNRVGFWWRTLATFIDLILVGVLISVLNIGVPLIPFFAYFIIFWGWKGSTLGGMALGLRVQKLSGEPLDWSTAIIRSLSSLVSLLSGFLGFFWAGWDPENQSWHDKIAGTTVVQIPKGYTWD